ncbi:ABC transporter permease subunit [Paraferrimonas sp. SM1919]|uniref:ABC transporter permease subunit n=1 Tax=Paraferrimonas sp. SM1919 TaxID=2662263 RepID=UPI0013D43736|nr:ABC transporter permease subunit [Paraferrimonas sp. SM1919]
MARGDIYLDEAIATPLQLAWARFIKNPLAIAGLWVLIILALVMVFAPWISPYPPEQQHLHAQLLPPSWNTNGQVDFFLGTDELGRDILSRLIHGSSQTFGNALLVVNIALFVGFITGSISGMTRGVKSSILSHLLDALLSIPTLLLAILIVAVTGPGIENTLWAVCLTLIPQFVRNIHNTIHTEMQKEYVTAARLDGANRQQIYWYVVMPNVWDSLILQITLALSTAILDIAALGFLGLGAQSPSVEWGAMVSQGAANLLYAPWTVTIPGLAILFSVLATNFVGDGLRRAFNKAGGK